MDDQKRTQPQPGKRLTDDHHERPADDEEDRFDEKRVNRDRSVVEQANQGQGPLNVGDQSRARN
jgi:hypothetical protein